MRALVPGPILASCLALGALGASGARAQEEQAAPTVQEMLPACEAYGRSPPPADPWLIFQVGECVGTIAGISNLMEFNCDSLKDGTGRPFAPFTAVLAPDRGAAVQAWLDWAHAHPERAEEEFAVSVIRALGEAFPCPS